MNINVLNRATICPGCGERVRPQPVGLIDEDGEWEYEYSDCPICEHIFTAKELTTL